MKQENNGLVQFDRSDRWACVALRTSLKIAGWWKASRVDCILLHGITQAWERLTRHIAFSAVGSLEAAFPSSVPSRLARSSRMSA